MKNATVQSAVISGIEAFPVEIEAQVVKGDMPMFAIVGMPDAAIMEARERVKGAIRSSGFGLPACRIVVCVHTEELRHSRSELDQLDLPIAAAILEATGQLSPSATEGLCLLGTLKLGGEAYLRSGIAAYAAHAAKAGLKLACGTPYEAAGAVCRGALGVPSLEALRHELGPLAFPAPMLRQVNDFAEVPGFGHVKRALQIAAAGRHGITMIGRPSRWRSELAACVPGILPPMTEDEMRECATIHSVADQIYTNILAGDRPFRAPHYSVSIVGLIGGGRPVRPGEASLAHNGVLYLEEVEQMSTGALQSLRCPHEQGQVTVTRAEGTYTMPARFLLIASASPCPCGFFGSSAAPCRCSAAEVENYSFRLEKSLRGLTPMRVDAEPTREPHELDGASSAQLREGVERAIAFKAWRDAHGKEQRSFISTVVKMLDKAAGAWNAREIMAALSVAGTIADMDESDEIRPEHMAEALSLSW